MKIVPALLIGAVPPAAALAAVAQLLVGGEPSIWDRGAPGVAGLVAVAIVFAAGSVTLFRAAAALLHGPGHARTEQQFERLVAETRTDSLTQVGNRRAFTDDLGALLGRRNRAGSVFSLMAIDVDGLKEINDTRGHPAGDAHLRFVASRLAAEVGGRGTVYRTGGDEFMVLLPGMRNLHAIELAHRIQAATRGARGARAVSIGVTETKGTEHRQELVRQADLALYEAKRERLPVVPYQPSLEAGESSAYESRTARKQAIAASLARMVDARDPTLGRHAESVADLAAAVGRLQGIEGRRLERLWTAALLHDVGKMAIPDTILLKREPLTAEEHRLLRDHVTLGRDLLAAAGFGEEAEWVSQHHERPDGSGYPGRLPTAEVAVEARIIAVADAYDAMTGPRAYREQLTPEQALAELSARSGTQFDRQCVRALADVVRGAAAGQRRRPPRSAAGAGARR